jgi:SagB-type dehydrogenase family enzyme
MPNSNTALALNYHEATKHSLQRLQSSRHFLDWVNEPLKYKLYQEVEFIQLPTDLPETGIPTLASLEYGAAAKEAVPGIRELAYLLYYTGGVTKKLVHAGGEIYFRAASSAGALYPIEIYLVCKDLPGLEEGVYHFNPARFGLHKLRQDDYRSYLFQAGAEDTQLIQAPLCLVFTGITWRTAWKYQARSYRYHYWDCGTMLANALAAANALELPAKILMGFVDSQVNRLVGIDGQEEKSLCLVPVGSTTSETRFEATSWDDLPEIKINVRPLSRSKVDYPLIDTLHSESELNHPQQVSDWRGEPILWQEAESAGQLFPLQVSEGGQMSDQPLENTILERGSSRRFSREAIQFSELSTLLLQAAAPFPACWLEGQAGMLNELYLSVHAVEGLPSGTYVYHPGKKALELLQRGELRGEAAHLCLGQDLGGDASVTFFFLADLKAILERYGNRGYRLVQMEAGISGGKLYLGAYALGRGATGLTFFDDDVVRFFSPHAAGLEAIFVVAMGAPATSAAPVGRMVRLSPGEPVDIKTQGGVA